MQRDCKDLDNKLPKYCFSRIIKILLYFDSIQIACAGYYLCSTSMNYKNEEFFLYVIQQSDNSTKTFPINVI